MGQELAAGAGNNEVHSQINCSQSLPSLYHHHRRNIFSLGSRDVVLIKKKVFFIILIAGNDEVKD